MLAKSLKSDFNIDAEILTRPFDDERSHQMLRAALQDPPLRAMRSEVTYHVLTVVAVTLFVGFILLVFFKQSYWLASK